MNTHILAIAAGLSDRDLLARLFSYCTQALRLSEDAACSRIEAARACRRFPMILDLLASGELTLTSVRLLGRHLTPENHQAVLVKAARRNRQHIEALVAELAPRPDVPTLVRRLPTLTATASPSAAPAQATLGAASEPTRPVAPASAAFISTLRPVVQATAPERYRVQFTIGPETHDKLRRLQGLLRREIPDGDPGVIFDRALTLLLEKVEKKKLGAAARPRPRASIRPRTDRPAGKPALDSGDVPPEVRQAVWRRDGGQCAFVSPTGRRCTERTYVEFHHIHPRAKQGPATVENISLRCWRHNQYEAELVFGPRRC